MSRATAIAPYLPFLRRYARALTGSQVRGDSYVRACLEAIIANPDVLSPDLPPRVALYRVFHAIWRSTAGERTGVALVGDAAKLVEVRIARLVPRQRQALLLTTLEGFNSEEAGQILDTSATEVERLVADSLSEIARDLATGVLIIEDEPVIALDLSNIVEELGHEVVRVVTTRDAAVAAARQRRPGIVLADIQLADDSSGIDAVKDILGDGHLPVIFITAYPERLLTGERPEPTFLITKPFKPETVKATISQALFFQSAEESV